MRWAILAYLILNPLFFLPGVQTRDAQQVFYQLSSVIIFACGMFFKEIRKPKLDPIHVCLGVMLIAFVGAWLRSMNGWTITLNYILGLMVYFTIIRTMTRDDLRFAIKGVIFICILATIWLALQRSGYDLRGVIISNTTKVGRNSLFFHASSMGMYFAQSIPLIMSNTWLGILFIYPMRYGECEGAYLGTIAAILFFYWYQKRIVVWCLIPFIIGAVVFIFIDPALKIEAERSIGRRVPLWGMIIHRIMRCPIGHGLESFNNPVIPGQYKFLMNHDTSKLYLLQLQRNKLFLPTGKITKEELNYTVNLDHPHNEYVWLGYEVGMHAWVILTFLFYFIWMRFKRSRKDILIMSFMCSLISFAVFSVSQFSLHLSRVGYMLPIILGGFMITTEEDDERGHLGT